MHQLHKLMVVDEIDRLPGLRAARSDLNQLRVSPRQGWLFFRASIVLARSTGGNRVEQM